MVLHTKRNRTNNTRTKETCKEKEKQKENKIAMSESFSGMYGISKDRVKNFNKQLRKVMKKRPYTWCIRRDRLVATAGLHGRICCGCKYYKENGGRCDPL
jgi:hypothetical protein